MLPKNAVAFTDPNTRVGKHLATTRGEWASDDLQLPDGRQAGNFITGTTALLDTNVRWSRTDAFALAIMNEIKPGIRNSSHWSIIPRRDTSSEILT